MHQTESVLSKLTRFIIVYKTRAKERNYDTILVNLVSAIFVASATLFFKLSRSVGNEMSLVVGVCGALTSITLLALRKCQYSHGPDNVDKQQKNNLFTFCDIFKVLFLGVVFSGAYTHFYFISLNYVTMGDAVSVTFCVHFVCNIVLESLALKKSPHPLTLFAGALGLTGLLLICQPENIIALQFDLSQSIGVACGAISGISGTLFYIGIQKFKNVPVGFAQLAYFVGPVVYCSYSFVESNLQLTICSLELKLMAIFGCLLYIFGCMAAVKGSQMSLPSIATLLKLFTIILGYILQIMFLTEQISLFSLFGAGLILSSILSQSLLLVKGIKP